MNSNWLSAQLGEITTKIGSGATPLGGEAAYKENGTSLIRSLNVHDCQFRRKDLAFIDEEQAGRLRNVVVESGDVLLNITGASVARCCVVPDGILPARVNQHVAIIRPQPNQLLPQFLQYLLVSGFYKNRLLRAGEDGATRQALTKAQLNDFVVEFPAALEEQARVVGILDEAFKGIATARANAEKNLQNARELFEMHHEVVFARICNESAEVRLGDIASVRNGINYTKHSMGQSVRVIGVKDFQTNFWVPLDNLDTVVLDGNLREADSVAEGDIVTVRSNGNPALIGRCMLVGMLSEKTSHSGFTIRIRLHSGSAMPEYVCHFLKSRAVRAQLVAGGSGVGIRSLNQEMLSEITVPIPRPQRQRSVVAEIEEMAESTASLAVLEGRKLAALAELKASLLHQAFSGAL